MKCLAKDPDERYHAVYDLKADIEKFMRGAAAFPTTEFRAGTLLMQEHEKGIETFIINKGKVEVFKTSPDGIRIRLAILGPGSVVGEAAVLSGKNRTASAIAIDQVSATVLTRDQLERELGIDSWIGDLARALANRFVETNAMLDKVRTDLDVAHLENAALGHLCLFGHKGPRGRLEVGLTEMLAFLVGRLNKAEGEIRSHLVAHASFHVDEKRDTIGLIYRHV